MGERVQIMALADRVEALNGPNRDIGREVLLACGWTKSIVGHFFGPMYRWRSPDGKIDFDDDNFLLHDPTASIDSAMSLVPEGWEWQLWHGGVVSLKPNVVFISLREGAERRFEFRSDAASPALALTAASLRAIGEGL